MHPQTKLQNGEIYPLLLETTIGRYRRNNWPIPVNRKTADNRPIIAASLSKTITTRFQHNMYIVVLLVLLIKCIAVALGKVPLNPNQPTNQLHWK